MECRFPEGPNAAAKVAHIDHRRPKPSDAALDALTRPLSTLVDIGASGMPSASHRRESVTTHRRPHSQVRHTDRPLEFSRLVSFYVSPPAFILVFLWCAFDRVLHITVSNLPSLFLLTLTCFFFINLIVSENDLNASKMFVECQATTRQDRLIPLAEMAWANVAGFGLFA